MDRVFCPKCNRQTVYRTIAGTRTYPVLGESIPVHITIAQCIQCGAECEHPVLREQNETRANDAYREKHNLPSPRQLRELRETMGLSPLEFASALGWSVVDVKRYESGALVDKERQQTLSNMLQNGEWKPS